MITHEQWAEVRDSSITLWNNETKRKKDFIADTFNRQDTNDDQEIFEGVGSLGLMSPWNGSVSYEDFVKGFKKTFNQARFSKGTQAEEWLFRYGKYRQIAERVKALHETVYQTYQTHGASVFNNANNVAYAGADAVALCSASHPLSPSDAAVQSNLAALDLTPANVNTVFNAMVDIKNDKSQIVGVTPNVILTGNYYRDKAKKIVGSEKEPFTAENDMNTWDGLSHMYNPRITGKAWFLIDSQRMNQFLLWFDGRKADFDTETEFDTEIMKFRTIADLAYGWTHWDWIYGNFVA
jgi:hypothetical protein